MKTHTEKFRNWIFIFISFCAINILCLATGRTFAQTLRNGGFESSDTGTVSSTEISGWLIQVAGGVSPVPEFKIVDDSVKEGNRALKVLVNDIGTNQWDIQVISDSIPAKQDATYSYSIWAKAEKPGAQVNFTVGNYAYSEYKVIRPANLTTEWKQYTMQFTVTDNQTYIRAPIHLNYAGNVNNTIYIDDLQIVDVKFGKTPIAFEAESGIKGSNFTTQILDTITYVTTNSNYTGLASPGDTSRIITYQVNFQDSGNYNLFVRMRVGAGGFNDDSFFAGKGFGIKNDTLGTDWVFVNGLAGAGFTKSTDVVDPLGTAGNEVWKWVNITKNFFPIDTTGAPFHVSLDSLTKSFQIGSREDGLYFDKIAFGKSYLYYTVEDLDKGLPGATTTEKPVTYYYPGPPLAEGLSKFLGNALGDIPDSVFAHYWNQLTPGNAGKFGSVGTLQDTTKWNWTGLDRAHTYAVDHNLIFKDHCLIWGQQQPSWISSLDSAQQIHYIETWIRMVGQRYPDMDMIDVVNEALPGHNPPDGGSGRANYKNALGGNGTTGYDWVIKSFELARTYLPGVKLLLNDYGIINDYNATTTYLQIINLLKDRGLIDGIGVQGHRFELETASTASLKSNLDRLAATGLPIYISEFDLGNLNNSGTPNDAQQLELYKKIFPVLWEHPGVKGITLWGYLEGQMWQTTCHVVNFDGKSRPALDWLADYVKTATGIEEIENSIASDIRLEQNYPNPFSSVTNISFTTTKTANVSIKVFDILGKEIAILVDQNLTPGVYNIAWNPNNSNGSDLTSGIYYYRMVVGNTIITKTMQILK
jgi:endo-1,4-beta-xylanase